MNKTQLVDALAERLGDRGTAATAVDGLLETIMTAVGAGDSVSITGFGVFEPRARAARTARNPRTGEAVDVAATTVPAFRPGAGFRSVVGGTADAPARRATPARARASAATTPEVGPDAPAPAVEDTAKPARRAAKARAFAARPTPEQPIPDPKAKAKAKAGKDPDRSSGKAGKDPDRSSGKATGKDSGKDSGKGKKGKGKK